MWKRTYPTIFVISGKWSSLTLMQILKQVLNRQAANLTALRHDPAGIRNSKYKPG